METSCAVQNCRFVVGIGDTFHKLTYEENIHRTATKPNGYPQRQQRTRPIQSRINDIQGDGRYRTRQQDGCHDDGKHQISTLKTHLGKPVCAKGRAYAYAKHIHHAYEHRIFEVVEVFHVEHLRISAKIEIIRPQRFHTQQLFVGHKRVNQKRVNREYEKHRKEQQEKPFYAQKCAAFKFCGFYYFKKVIHYASSP